MPLASGGRHGVFWERAEFSGSVLKEAGASRVAGSSTRDSEPVMGTLRPGVHTPPDLAARVACGPADMSSEGEGAWDGRTIDRTHR